VLSLGSIFLYNGLILAGWIFAWIVIFLAAANLFWILCRLFCVLSVWETQHAGISDEIIKEE
jgi:hypothetical protein